MIVLFFCFFRTLFVKEMNFEKHHILFVLAAVLLVTAILCGRASPMKEDGKTPDADKQTMYKNCSYACYAIAAVLIAGGAYMCYKPSAKKSLTSEIASIEMY